MTACPELPAAADSADSPNQRCMFDPALGFEGSAGSGGSKPVGSTRVVRIPHEQGSSGSQAAQAAMAQARSAGRGGRGSGSFGSFSATTSQLHAQHQQRQRAYGGGHRSSDGHGSPAELEGFADAAVSPTQPARRAAAGGATQDGGGGGVAAGPGVHVHPRGRRLSLIMDAPVACALVSAVFLI